MKEYTIHSSLHTLHCNSSYSAQYYCKVCQVLVHTLHNITAYSAQYYFSVYETYSVTVILSLCPLSLQSPTPHTKQQIPPSSSVIYTGPFCGCLSHSSILHSKKSTLRRPWPKLVGKCQIWQVLYENKLAECR